MGAVLGCCGGPSTDYDAVYLKNSSARYHPLLGRCDAVEKSLLGTLQRSLSMSWSSRLVLGDAVRSPHTHSHAGSRYGLDDHYESEGETDDEHASDGRGGATGSIASATSGSRLLCDFYNLVLECDHSKFFVDAHGRRVKGAYLKEVEILDDYFDTTRRMTVGTRRRRRFSVDVLPYQPPQKLKHLGSNYDRSSHMSLMSNETTQTLASESDYWATFMDAPEEPVDFVTEMTFPPKYGAPQLTPLGTSRTRRDSGDRRRSWVLQDQQQQQQYPTHGSSLDVAASSLLLFSPVNAGRAHDPAAPPALARQPSWSRSSVRSPHGNTIATPMEGSRYNLWDVSKDDGKTAVVPEAFSTAAVSERRRASLAKGADNDAATGNTSRRMSAHTIAPIAV